jgi:hypothetical protein
MTVIVMRIYWVVKMDVARKIEQIWNEDFREEYESRFRKTAVLTNGRYTFKAVFDPGREKARKERKEDAACPFDSVEYLHRCQQGNSLHYVVNIYPYFDRHFVAFPLEHRDFPAKEDLEELIELQRHTSHVLMMNMREAGANIPGHIHYQCILEELPIDEQEGHEIFSNKDVKVERVDFPVYALRFSWNSERGKDESEALVLGIDVPRNLHIYKDRICMIPRTGSYSSASPETKIGCTEVGGLFLITSEEVFEQLSYEYLESVIKEVTFADKKKQKEAENSLKNLLWDYEVNCAR